MASIKGGTSELVTSIVGAIQAPAKAEEAARKAEARRQREEERAHRRWLDYNEKRDHYVMAEESKDDILNLQNNLDALRDKVLELETRINMLTVGQTAMAQAVAPPRVGPLSGEYTSRYAAETGTPYTGEAMIRTRWDATGPVTYI